MNPNKINKQYRLDDYERWQRQDFVLGIEIHRSPTNPCDCEICSAMIGIYPKNFKFIGWHEGCICIQVANMLEGEEFIDYLIDGKIPESALIKTMPEKALNYIKENYEEIKNEDWFVLNQKLIDKHM